MIDSHTHLDALEDTEGVLARAREAGVTCVVSVGCGLERIARTLEIAAAHDDVRVVAGVHPQEAQHFDLDLWPEVERLCAHERVVGIGETGFDLYRDYGTVRQQEPVFELHAALARRRGLPLIVHTRAAEQHTLDALARHADGLDVVLHCFSLTEQIDDVIERGYWCSFAGNVTYASAQDLRDAAARVPAERLLVETDAPYLTPVPHRGKRNEPAFVAHTLAAVAAARDISVAEAEALTTQNALQLFRLDPSLAHSGKGASTGTGAATSAGSA